MSDGKLNVIEINSPEVLQRYEDDDQPKLFLVTSDFWQKSVNANAALPILAEHFAGKITTYRLAANIRIKWQAKFFHRFSVPYTPTLFLIKNKNLGVVWGDFSGEEKVAEIVAVVSQKVAEFGWAI